LSNQYINRKRTVYCGKNNSGSRRVAFNLSPDKCRVFAEAYRALKPGGRLVVSGIVLLKPLPSSILNSIEAYVGCIAGAAMKSDYTDAIRAAGFRNIVVFDEIPFPIDCLANDPAVQEIIKDLAASPEMIKEVASSVISMKISGVKPK